MVAGGCGNKLEGNCLDEAEKELKAGLELEGGGGAPAVVVDWGLGCDDSARACDWPWRVEDCGSILWAGVGGKDENAAGCRVLRSLAGSGPRTRTRCDCMQTERDDSLPGASRGGGTFWGPGG
jgi:hypothetical protein